LTGGGAMPETVTVAGIPWLRRLADPPPRPVSYIPYDIPLRVTPRCVARVVLPDDFATADAERLCGVLRAVALPEGEPGA
jgi:hypothetical protein